MKKVLVILVSITLSLGVSAQRKGGYFHSYAPRVIVAPSFGYGIGFGYPFFGYPFFGYPYYGNPYGYGNPYANRGTPYKLSLQIQSIKTDYKNQIRETRHNKSMSHSQRRQEIRSLKTERDQAILTAEQNFRYGNQNRSRNNNQYQGPNNQNPGTNNQNPGANNQFQNNGNTSSGSNS